MPGLPFTTLDVFTNTPYKGNPLAVVTLPVGTTLTQPQKQAIAVEFNLSETVFVHDVNAPADTDQRDIDIFTPQAELPFAGHPTIGTAAFLYPQGVRALITKAGPIKIELLGDNGIRASIPYNVRLHRNRLPGPEKGSESPSDIARAETGAPLFSIVKGMTFALIEVPSLQVLGTAKVGAPELAAELLDDGWREGWVTRRYYYVRMARTREAERTIYKIRTRLIKLATEDAATGSAACALSAYLSLHVVEEQLITFEITQGVEMGRESTIQVDVEVGIGPDGKRQVEALYLGGQALPIMTGAIMTRP